MTSLQLSVVRTASEVESPRTYAALLKKCALFRGAADGELDVLASRVSVVRGRDGTVLLPQNAPGDQLCFIYAGRVKVTLYENGREVTLALLRAGDVIGEMCVIEGTTRSATVVADGDAILLTLPREEFLLHLRRSPQTSMNLIGELARRLRRANDSIFSLALQDVEARLIKTLIQLARDEGGVATDGSMSIRRRPAQQDLANMIGSSRETVSRTMAAMVRQGLILNRGRSLLLSERLLRRGCSAALV